MMTHNFKALFYFVLKTKTMMMIRADAVKIISDKDPGTRKMMMMMKEDRNSDSDISKMMMKSSLSNNGDSGIGKMKIMVDSNDGGGSE